MSNAHIESNKQASTTRTRSRCLRLSAMSLLAAGALCATHAAHAQVNVTSAADLAAVLNTDEDVSFLNNVDLGGNNFNVTRRTQFFGSGGTRTISNGTITVIGSTSFTNYVLFNPTPSVIFTGDVILDPFSQIDIDAPTAIGVGGSVDADENAGIRLFTGDGQTNTWDSTFFAKINGVANSTTFAIVGDGVSVLTALPTFDSAIQFNIYNDFDDFAEDPALDPTLRLAANLAGNHDLTINVGTLDLDDFDFTVDSITGEEDTEITLGSGTLTTGDASSTTYAGVISGTGDLVKTGTGTFTLTGVNTYTGTTTVTEGTLRLEADQTGPTSVTIEDGGIVSVDAAQTGDPDYLIESGGILNLNADLADTTPITVDAGGRININIRPQTIASIAGGGTVNLNNTTLTVGDANSTTFSGDFIGMMGGVTKVGTGTLTLSGTSTYTGATTLSEGLIILDGDLTNTSSLTLAAGTTLTLNGDINNNAPVAVATGATLDLNDNDETVGRLTGGGDVTLGSATLTVGDTTDFTFGGTLSETGGLTKQGTGTMTLSGAQTYTGATTINAGTLVANGDLATSGVTVGNGAIFNLESVMTDANADVTVNDGGTLFGTGTVGDDLINNGTVTFLGPGLGDTLTVNGDYTQGATGVLNVQIANPGGLVVTGTANLGGTLNITTPADPANFDINATYDIITAGGTSGSFATVTDDFAFLDLTANNVQITLARNAVAINSITQTANQTNIANILDTVGPTDELEDALNRILASSETGALNTLNQLAGAAAATTSTQMAASAAMQSHRLMDQVVGVRPGSSRPLGAFGPSAGPIEFDDADHITLLSFAQDTANENADTSSRNYTPWASIYGGFGDQGDGPSALDYTRYGLLAGVDLTADESDARYGLSLGIEQTDFDLTQNTGEIEVQSIYLSGYTRQSLGNGFHFTLLGTLGYHSHDSQRNLLIGATPSRAQADFDSYSVTVAGEISKAFNIERIPVDPGGHPTVTTIEPFARIDYSLSSQDGYTETGAGTAGLNVDAEDFDSSRVAVGVRVEHQFMIFNQKEAVFRGNALANFALSNSDSTLGVSFVNTPGSNFELVGSDQDDIYGQIGLGLSVEINDSWDLHFDVDQQFSDSATGTVFAGMLSYEF